VSRKPTKLIGLSINEFEKLVAKGDEIFLRPARLIPFHKPGDEMAITSVFLAGLRLIKEFRDQVFQTIGLKKRGKMFFYCEPTFGLFDEMRPDGLILVCSANQIVDAVLLEVKTGKDELKKRQIEDYFGIAKKHGIPKLLTVSNQFVSFPTQSPIHVKPPKKVTTYHLSWSFIRIIAQILIRKNDNNIADADQIEIMTEILSYFEAKGSGIVGFTEMKPGWSQVTKDANAGTKLKLSDKSVDETVSSWLQEERDMALHLSRELGLLVESGNRRFRNDLPARVEFEKRELIAKKRLESTLQVDGGPSSIQVLASFDKKTIEISSTLTAPQNKKSRGKISWINRQLKAENRGKPEFFAKLKPNLFVEVYFKFGKQPLRIQLANLEDAIDEIGGKDIKSFKVLYFLSLGRKFEGPRIVVQEIEKMLLDYYSHVFQYLKRWEKPVPKISEVIMVDPCSE
jgi:hypothetical protein